MIGCSKWDVTLSLVRAADLAVQGLLVGFGGLEQVNPLLQGAQQLLLLRSLRPVGSRSLDSWVS